MHAKSTHPGICSRFGSESYQGTSGDMLAALSTELATLSVGSRDGIWGCREMGCSTDRQAEPSSPLKQYRVRLLPEGPPGMPAKKLADAFPKLAVPRARTR